MRSLVSFEDLGVRPDIVHGTIGKAVWQNCWGNAKEGNRRSEHVMPQLLVGVLRWVLMEVAHPSIRDDKFLEEGEKRYRQAVNQASIVRAKGMATDV